MQNYEVDQRAKPYAHRLSRNLTFYSGSVNSKIKAALKRAIMHQPSA